MWSVRARARRERAARLHGNATDQASGGGREPSGTQPLAARSRAGMPVAAGTIRVMEEWTARPWADWRHGAPRGPSNFARTTTTGCAPAARETTGITSLASDGLAAPSTVVHGTEPEPARATSRSRRMRERPTGSSIGGPFPLAGRSGGVRTGHHQHGSDSRLPWADVPACRPTAVEVEEGIQRARRRRYCPRLSGGATTGASDQR